VIVCEGCGINFSLPIGRVSKRKFCSKACAYKHRRVASQDAQENRNWRGGHAVSYGRNWRLIKDEVRARDGVCRTCGKTPEENSRALDVHHLNPFRFSGDNSLENLIALCHSCHMRADDHGRAGAAKFLRNPTPKRATKREIRRLRQLIREAERRARRRENQRVTLAMNEGGASLREIARVLGVSHETVSRWIKGDYRVQEAPPHYLAHRARTRRRPLRARLLSCPSLSAR
jgi:5-methylcytosine-specific restriction endonuclease McrA